MRTRTSLIEFDPMLPMSVGFAHAENWLQGQVLVSTRNGTAVLVFTTADGSYYTPNIVDVTTATAGFAGLGLAAGAGDTFWATSSGDFPLTRVFYDLINGHTNAIQLSLAGPSDTTLQWIR